MSFVSSADGTLVVVVCRAKHLPNRRKMDKQSPYVALRIGLVAEKTPAHFRAGQTPEWAFEVRFALTRERSPLMKVDVLDETKGIPTPIGSCEIDCSRVFMSPNLKTEGKFILDSWYDLLFHEKRAGMIYLEMTFYPSAPIPPPRIEHHANPATFHPPNSYAYPHGSLSPNPSPHMRLVSVNEPVRNLTYDYETPVRSSDRTIEHFSQNISPPSPKRSGDISSTRTRWSQDTNGREVSPHGWSKKLAYFTNAQPLQTPTLPNREPTHSPIRGTFGKLKKILALKETTPTFEESTIQPEPFFDEAHHGSDPSLQLQNDLTEYGGRREQTPPPIPSHSANSPLPRRLPRRKAPSTGEALARLDRLALDTQSSGPLPFSADTIGLGDDIEFAPPTVLNASLPAVKSDELDPRFHAPTPGEFLSSRDRYRRGYGPSPSEVYVDLNTDETGYLGDGKFSPSVFDRAVLREPDHDSKPQVPPKIPKGLSEAEYYVLEKERYLRDLAGNRY